MEVTKLSIQDKLPLTCTRSGTCCHDKNVLINPWETVCLANEKKITPREFRDLYCDFGGIRLKFKGKPDSNGKQACDLYTDNFGCSVHLGRPLACRLFPLGRQIQNEEVNYIFEGKIFPCINGCPSVVDLPLVKVEEYLKQQKTIHFEAAQDAYLDIMQDIADIAFMLLLDTQLAESGETNTLKQWRILGNDEPEILAKKIGNEWLDYLTLPEIVDNWEDPIAFTQAHTNILHSKAQVKIDCLQTNLELHEASVLMMGIALFLAIGIGANKKELVELWIETAKNNGAKE